GFLPIEPFSPRAAVEPISPTGQDEVVGVRPQRVSGHKGCRAEATAAEGGRGRGAGAGKDRAGPRRPRPARTGSGHSREEFLHLFLRFPRPRFRRGGQVHNNSADACKKCGEWGVPLGGKGHAYFAPLMEQTVMETDPPTVASQQWEAPGNYFV